MYENGVEILHQCLDINVQEYKEGYLIKFIKIFSKHSESKNDAIIYSREKKKNKIGFF